MHKIKHHSSCLTIAALVVLGSFSGCRTAVDDVPEGRAIPVTILVELDRSGQAPLPVAIPDQQIVRLGQEVEWVTDEPGATIEIFFKGENPLQRAPRCVRQSCIGGPPKLTSKGGRFAYGIRVTTPGGRYESDPILIVRD